MMLVSHDRRFLDRVVTHVVELDEFTHRIAEYAGGWQASWWIIYVTARKTFIKSHPTFPNPIRPA